VANRGGTEGAEKNAKDTINRIPLRTLSLSGEHSFTVNPEEAKTWDLSIEWR